jgi:hypothetical protein
MKGYMMQNDPKVAPKMISSTWKKIAKSYNSTPMKREQNTAKEPTNIMFRRNTR